MSISISAADTIGKTASSPLVFKDAAVLSLLAIGEETKLSILQRLSSRQYLVAVKDRMVLADSASPLKVGSELRVRVDTKHPAVVLRILSEIDSPRNVFTENLRMFRANPQGLLIHFVQLEALLVRATLHGCLPALLRDDIGVLLQSMQALHYSQDAAGTTSYLKNYLANLGLLFESDLKKNLTANGARKRQSDGIFGGVKGLLFRLADKVNALLGDETLKGETGHLLEELQASMEKSIKTLENQQVLNVLLQETAHTHLLQIPMHFPGGMKLGEIFIRSDTQDDSRGAGEKSFAVELLFELDEVGHLLVEVHMYERKLDCVCKCGDEAVSEFIASHLPELHEQLLSAGYTVERLSCVVAKDMEEQKSALYRAYRLTAEECINLFA